MRYELTVTKQLDSRHDQDRVAKLFECVFDYGTAKEAIAEGLQLLQDPRLLAVDVKRKPRHQANRSAGDVT